MQVDPVKADLIELLFGRELVRSADDDFLGRQMSLAVFKMACSGLFVGTISGLTFLPARLGPLDDGGHQLLIVSVEVERRRGRSPRRRHRPWPS